MEGLYVGMPPPRTQISRSFLNFKGFKVLKYTTDKKLKLIYDYYYFILVSSGVIKMYFSLALFFSQ